jgi:hypothetical protein
MRVVGLILVGLLFSVHSSPATAQQEFPASAVTRGENIRLRIEPAEDTEVLAYLQRGDRIRIMGETTFVDGNGFYPIEVVETGETGWIRDLAVDPRSLVALEALPVVEVEEAPSETAARADNSERSGRGGRQETEREGSDARGSRGTSVPGVGTTVSDNLTLAPGRYRATVTMRVTDYSGFIADLHGPDGFSENIFNEIIDAPQRWNAETIVDINTGGEYFVEVSNTDAEWEIEFIPT